MAAFLLAWLALNCRLSVLIPSGPRAEHNQWGGPGILRPGVGIFRRNRWRKISGLEFRPLSGWPRCPRFPFPASLPRPARWIQRSPRFALPAGSFGRVLILLVG